MISSVQVPAVSGVLSFVWAVVVPWSCEDFHRRTRLADRGSGGCFNDLNNLLAGVGVHLHFATGQPFCPSLSIFVVCGRGYFAKCALCLIVRGGWM